MRHDLTAKRAFGDPGRTLSELSADFPASTLTSENLGRHGYCYVAEQTDHTGAGPQTLITADADELRRELARGLKQRQPRHPLSASREGVRRLDAEPVYPC